jgi:RNA polymerase sigma-70 factor (ECF subfamily)
MRRPEPDLSPDLPRRPSFESTHWSLVLAAADREAPWADEALAALCASYWYPLYAFIRRRGHDPDRAADLTQGFFARLLEKEFLRSVDPSRGRFRAFLLAACKNFLANEHDQEHARKRGGGRSPVSIDLRDAEGRYLAEPSHDLTPEWLFERRWALTILEESLDQLERESRQAGKAALYELLKSILTGAESSLCYAEVGRALGMTEAAVKKAAQRLRQRYREILRGRIGGTVDDPGEVDDELRTLFAILAS